jgi:hypothetical protein
VDERLPKWFREEVEKGDTVNVKDKANKQEKNFAKRTEQLGGRRQPASGALWGAKGDVKIGSIALGDSKFTKYKSFNITTAMWKKICMEALEQRKDIPFIQLEMSECEPLIVISENDFIMLLGKFME